MRTRINPRWLARMLIGIGIAVISLEIAWIFGRDWWWVGVVAGLVALFGLAFAALTEWHERQARRLRRSTFSVQLPASWSVKRFKTTPTGFIAPLAVIRDDGMRFIVDIRHWDEVGWSPVDESPDATPQPAWLIDGKGRPLSDDPLVPLQKAAVAASAAPVLWVPDDEEGGVHRHPHSNVLLVTGPPRDLKQALMGARLVPRSASAPTTQPPQVR